MKKITNLLILILTVSLTFSCKYDDSYLKREINILKTDIAGLKKQTDAIQKVVDALNKGKYISAVEEQKEKNIFRITFSDGQVIEVMNGTTVPVIGVSEEDGIYYWTVTTGDKTNFLLDKNGNKLPVSGKPGEPGEPGSTPELGIDADGYWTINGERIKDANGAEVKAQGDAFFKEIRNTEEEVTFILADGTSIVIPKLPDTYLTFTGEEAPIVVFQPGKQKKFNFIYANITKIELVNVPEGWEVNLHLPNQYVNVKAPSLDFKMGQNQIILRGWDKKGRVYEAIIVVSVADTSGRYNDPSSTYILNEGNMTTENGSLIYISPEGEVNNKIYMLINGRELGNTTQDLFIKEGKMWIISQNGKKSASGFGFENEGMLVKVDLATMIKEAAFDDLLRDGGAYKLNWPTHIAVLDDSNIFIRDNNGVHHFNSVTGELTLIDGTRGAEKNRMAVANNKVFVINKKNLFVLEANNKSIVRTIELPTNITGIERAYDDNLWVSITKPAKFIKLNTQTYEILQQNDVTEGELGRGWTSTPAFTSKGDTLYYNNGGTVIYRHIFKQKVSKRMVDVKEEVENANIVYNGIGVNPVTGDVYMNTIKSYGFDYLNNNISVFNFDSADPLAPVLKANYTNYTHFPAGFFFPANYK